MKLRIDGLSMRLRLTSEEVAQLAQEGRVGEALPFGGTRDQELRYSLVVSDEAAALGVEYDAGDIRVIVPRAWAENWPESDSIGLDGALPNGTSLLVEKDIGCRHGG